ncbi:hypermethylated in cancer 1 protein isoform X1 [Conger conger]|uniref:hypermethylated in cancer 1 protein isoform X1 n=2 Tax=Conger conger TaxID=82655 RepID=UPI002A5B0797|nr:hypermethylated in cancer 1 protein isoform X1 [Conger conger]
MIIKGDLERMAEEFGHPGGTLKTMLDAMEVPSHARHLLLQLNSQRTKGFLCDVIIVVQNALFRAHKNILAASSLYLKSLVVHDNLINLDHEMVSPGVFRVILDYIYTGRLNEGDQGSGPEPNLGAVLAAASYLQLLDLVALCRKRLKRNGKYHHLRPTHGFAPYTKIGVGGGSRYRVSAPVIQSCFPGGVLSRPAQSEEMPPLVTHVGELYAPPSSQGPQIYPVPPPGLPLLPQSSLRPSGAERDCSPLYGLDLTKKSPDSQSQQTLSHPALSHTLLHHDEGRHSPAPPGTNGGPLAQGNDSAFSGEAEAEEYKGSLSSHPHLVPRHPHLHRSDSRGQDPYPCPPSAGSEIGGEGGGEQGSEAGKVYRWVKPEPMPYPPEDEEEDDEEEEEDEEGAGGDRGKDTNHRHHNHHKNGEEHKLGGAGRAGGYGSVGCEGEDEKSGSASEETGSSEGRPSPIFHMPYEPESFGDNLYVCIPCDKGFPSSEQLNAHVETHTEDELFGHPPGELGSSNGHGGGSNSGNSNPPGNALSAPLGLGAGAGLGAGEVIRPYRCSSCDKSYKDPATLRQHEKSHWLTRPYPCSICGKKFTQRGTMTRHMRSHLGLKPFACDACGMRFTRQYRLTEHMRIHSGEKPYECQVCGGKFAQQRNLISHMKMHSGSGVADGKLKMDFSDGLYPLGKYAEHLGLKPEKASALLAHASQHLLADTKAMESLYPLSKLAAEHLGFIHDKMDALRQPLGPPPSSQLSSEPRAIDRYSPS